MIGLGIGLNRLRLVGGNIDSPTNLTASFDIPTISGQVSWTDNSGGVAQYEVYSSYNGNPYVFLGTTLAGATSYIDTTCKQGASVVYRIRGKKGSSYSEYVVSSTINTPLCLKTNQSVLTTVTLNSIPLSSGGVTVNWGDGTSQLLSGNSTNIIKNYSATGSYDISFSGDIGNIVNMFIFSQNHINGDITNWVLPYNTAIRLSATLVTGDVGVFIRDNMCRSYDFNGNTLMFGDLSDITLPHNMSTIGASGINLTGKAPNIFSSSTDALTYILTNNYLDGTNLSVFRRGATTIRLDNQNVPFPTSEVDKFFKNAADWYQLNPPTANCTYNLSGTNMGIPTGGVANVDIVRLIGYYSAAGFAATVLVRTS